MIRDAHEDDIDGLFELAHRMYLESRYSTLPFDGEKARRMGRIFINREDRYFRVYEKDETPVAFCMGGITDYMFSDCLLAEEYIVYSDAKAPLSGLRLMKDFEKWAKDWGVLEINFSTTALGDDPRYEAFCTRLGYRPCGRHWKRRL